MAARPWVPSAVTTVWPHLAMKGDAHSAGAQVLRLRPGLRLVLVTGLLWLLSLLNVAGPNWDGLFPRWTIKKKDVKYPIILFYIDYTSK